VNLLDTAEAYGGGQVHRRAVAGSDARDLEDVGRELHSSELILGRWLVSRRRRDAVLVQTKVTPPLGRQRVLDSIDASLGRLQAGAIDLFLLHAFDPQTPLEETLAALAEAQQAGKIREVGCSNFSEVQLASALECADREGLPRLGVAQFNYNLAVRDAEGGLLPLCRRRAVGVETYSPLGAGFLTGKYRAGSPDLPAGSRFRILPGHTGIYFHQEKFQIVERLRSLSAEVRLPATTLAMAWVLMNADVDTVLVGARGVDQLRGAIAALEARFDPLWEARLLSADD